MNTKMLLTMAVFLTSALSPVARGGSLSTEVIGMFPRDAGEFAYADLRQARSLTWFPQLQKQVFPEHLRQFEQLLASAGVDPNSQIEDLAWSLIPAGLPSGAGHNTPVPTSEEVVGVALGQFPTEAVEAYFKAEKRTVVKVRDYSLYALSGTDDGGIFFCFMDSTSAAFGRRQELEKLLAVRYGEEQSLLSNTDLAPLISQANGSGVLWAVLSAPYSRLAMQQLLPETAEFPEVQQLVSTLRALSLGISADSGIQAHFEAAYGSPADANAIAALLQAGLAYQRYQGADSNPDLVTMLRQAKVTPSGDRLVLTLALADNQVVDLIQRNTSAIH